MTINKLYSVPKIPKKSNLSFSSESSHENALEVATNRDLEQVPAEETAEMQPVPEKPPSIDWSLQKLPRLNTHDAMKSIFQFLKEHVLFKDLDDDFLRILEDSMQVRVFSDKDYIIKRGEIGRAMFFIRRGVVDAISEDGK